MQLSAYNEYVYEKQRQILTAPFFYIMNDFDKDDKMHLLMR